MQEKNFAPNPTPLANICGEEVVVLCSGRHPAQLGHRSRPARRARAKIRTLPEGRFEELTFKLIGDGLHPATCLTPLASVSFLM